MGHAPCYKVNMLSKGPCGLMDKALVFGTKDCRFESCQGHCIMLHLYYERDVMGQKLRIGG